LKLSPAEQEVTVSKEPINGVSFSQFRATVRGSIVCLESCGAIHLTLTSRMRSDDKQITQAKPSGKSASFEFRNVMPGKYKVTLTKEEWCWKEKSGVEFDVLDKDVTSPQFTQTGYLLSCSLSHDITLNFAHETQETNVGSFNLTKGVNKFCLAQPGLYKLAPESCHMFEQSEYKYDTANPTILTMTAAKHKLEGVIVTQTRQNDIMVTIKSSVEGEAPIVVGPLADDQPPSSKSKSKSAKEKKTQAEASGTFTYRFTYWARSGEKLEVTPSSSELLFYPSVAEATVQGDKCPGEILNFEGRQGVFIEGSVQPALSGVLVTIDSETYPDRKVTIQTNEDGGYRVGPLHGDTEYTVEAEKEGYVLTPIDNKHGHFKAFKLGEIIVKVYGEKDDQLPGVFLSLSGGTNYRSNKLTLDDGSMTFSSLSPGQYFLRPMMKEYNFNPASQMIDVLEGSTVNLDIRGNRVAFSCYGSVTSLNGEPEPGVVVEAVGVGSESCHLLQEDSKTEQDGSYRIRGLKPECEYEVKLKTGDANQHIERSAPKSRTLKVEEQDLTDVNIIAFRRMNQLDLSGNVITSQEYLSSLKIHLHKESNPDVNIHTVSLGSTSFFYLPSLTIDYQKYVVRLDSSLSRVSFDYSLSEITFVANSSYRHFTFSFDPVRKQVDQELNQGSFLILPLTLLVIIAGYHYQKILPLLSQGSVAVQNILNKGPSTGSHQNTSAPIEINPELLSDAPSKKKKIRKT